MEIQILIAVIIAIICALSFFRSIYQDGWVYTKITGKKYKIKWYWFIPMIMVYILAAMILFSCGPTERLVQYDGNIIKQVTITVTSEEMCKLKKSWKEN